MIKVKFNVYDDEMLDDKFFNDKNLKLVKNEYAYDVYQIIVSDINDVIELLDMCFNFDLYRYYEGRLFYTSNNEIGWYDSEFEIEEIEK